MVNFGQLLLKSQYVPWSDHYLNYDLLKETLDHNHNNNDDQSFGGGGNGSYNSSFSSSSSIRSIISSNFLSLLYIETEKVSFFVLQQTGNITIELSKCRQQLIQLSRKGGGGGDDFMMVDNNTNSLDEIESNYVEIGKHLLRLIKFVNLNVTGFRKILKKHDKICRKNLSLSYLSLHHSGTSMGINNSRSSIQHRRRARYYDEDLNLIEIGNQLMQILLQDDTITAVTVAYESGIEDLRQKLHNEYYYHHGQDNNNNNDHYGNSDSNTRNFFIKLDRRSNTLPNFQDIEMITDDNDKLSTPSFDYEERTQRNKTSNMITKTPISHTDLRGMVDQGPTTKNASSRRQLLITTGQKVTPLQLLLQIHAARGRLHQTNEFVRLLAAPMLVPLPISEEEEDDDDAMMKEQDLIQQRGGSKGGGGGDRFSNTLNLLSTFFYMTNYYIVAPTSATYADKVGSDSSIASIIIGMTSFAALGSTVLYSYWTSYSYKSALIFASTCSAIGNLLYASGLPFQSLTLVMLGRLMNGFGSARSINRRYIADSFSVGERTSASAAFVTASALGMATGPFLASVLHIATSESTSVYWQAENAPGWLMFVVWTIFLICLILKFHDPPRKQRQQPKQQQGGDCNNEKKPLLGGQQNPAATSTNNESSQEEDDEDDDDVPLCCNIPVIITLIVYMVLKMILEAVLSSESNLTALYFGWEGNIMGVHLTLLALLILPVNFAVAFLARTYFDRELIIGLLVALLGGCIIIYQYQDDIEDYTLAQYLIGSALLFVCASALEAPNMSLLSKVIPRKWSKGIINVGLLATESGTLGRVIGDALLATMAKDGLETMLNNAFGTFGFIVLGVVIVCVICYRHLEPKEKDD